MQIIFLCGGGGRVIVGNQLLATGGFRVNFDQANALHVDPGPGALVKSIQQKQKMNKLEGIFVSHEHLDHYTDLHALVDAMAFGSKNKKGFVVGAESVIDGVKDFPSLMFPYFRSIVQECRALHAGEEFEWKQIKLRATKCVHEDPSAIGFVLSAGNARLGYTGDTELFEGIEKEFDSCDYLIINCLRPDRDKLEFHLSIEEASEMLNAMKKKPKQVFLSHLGMKFLMKGKEEQRRKFENLTGVEARLVEEGLKVDLSKKTLKDFS